MGVSQRLYFELGLGVLLLVGIGGSLYHGALLRTAEDAPEIWLAWGVFLASIYIQIALNWQTALVLGADRMADHYKIYISSRLSQVVLSVIGLLILPDLISLAIAHALSIVVSRVHSHLVVRDILKIVRKQGAAADDRAILRKLWPTAMRLGGVTIGEFLSNRFLLLIVSLAIGATAAAEFAITLQAMIVLLHVAQVAASISLPRIAAARMRGDHAELRELYAFGLVGALGILCLGLAGLLIAGEVILGLIGSNTMLPDRNILLALSLSFILTINVQVAANVLMSANKVPHTGAVLTTGAATAVAVSAAAWLGADLLTLVLVQAAIFAAYNAWKWPRMAFRDAGLTPANFWPSAAAGARRVLSGHAMAKIT